jgi:hypothetical protein
MSSNPPVFGKQTPGSARTEYNMLAFVFKQLLSRVQTVTLVQVISCSNNGGISPVGTVTVQPMVNQISGGPQQPTPHGYLYEVPYLRMQGGANAVILDPQPGDIGMCAFCSRDIATVKASKAPANPASFAMFDWADGLYLGGFLNGVPTQYVAFTPSGITVVSPDKITLQAPTVEIDASTEFHVVSPDSEFSGNIHTPDTITGDTDVIADGISGATHLHGGVQSGSSDTGPPV